MRAHITQYIFVFYLFIKITYDGLQFCFFLRVYMYLTTACSYYSCGIYLSLLLRFSLFFCFSLIIFFCYLDACFFRYCRPLPCYWVITIFLVKSFSTFFQSQATNCCPLADVHLRFLQI